MQEIRSVTGVLCSSYDNFFDAEKKIADCILEHKGEVIDMTVAHLARSSQTSDATVSRFCRKCGFKGFHHLKLSLAQEVAEEKGEKTKVSNDISRAEIAQSLQNILANKVAELTQTVSMMETDHIDRILTVLEHARAVQFAAVGNTIPVALDGTFKFNQLGIAAVSGTIWENQMAYACNMGKEGAIIIISSSGASRRLLSLIESAKRNATTIISITNNPESAIAEASDYHITTATRGKLLMGECCFSRVSAFTVIEILCLLLAAGKAV